MKQRLFLGLLAVGTLFVGTASAVVDPAGCTTTYTTAQSLSTLSAAGACLVSGDKVFWGFAQTGADFNITVTPIGNGIDDNGSNPLTGLYGIQFGGNMHSSTDLDFQLFYNVEVAPNSPLLISDIHQYANGAGPAGSIVITEVATDAGNPSNFARSTVTLTDVQDPPAEISQSDVLVFGTPVGFPDYVHVSKDIALHGTADSEVTLSIIQQRFSQVPEPREMAILLGLGMAALILKKRASANA